MRLDTTTRPEDDAPADPGEDWGGQDGEEGPPAGEGTAGRLLRQVTPIDPMTPCGQVYDYLAELAKKEGASPHSLAVVQGTRPIGLVHRHSLVEQFSRLYFRDLYGRRPVTEVMVRHPLVVEHSVGLDDLSAILSAGEDRYLYDGFIITRQGHYLGMGTGQDLMRLLTGRRQRHLYEMAYHDTLTGLPNRRLFYDRLARNLSLSGRQRREWALLFIDLDHFKLINDEVGHAGGDQLLVEAGRRMRACLRESDTLARLSGDEFTVILEEIRCKPDAALVSQKILDALALPFPVGGRELHVSASIGIAFWPGDGENADALVQNADKAAYSAKEARNSYRFYSNFMNAELTRRQSLEKDLREALREGHFSMHYQPLVGLDDGKICGAEALLRWAHPKRGMVPPSDFIPLAEETGLIAPLGDWALRAAAAQCRGWIEKGLFRGRMAVNLSPRQLRRPHAARTILEALGGAGLDPGSLELEITESVAVNPSEEVLESMALLRREGVSLAVDDFGTGYSSLSYLTRLPVNGLKVDRAFIHRLDSARDRALVRAILAMAGNLNLKVTAEGVETGEQLEFLLENGCEKMQGYLFSAGLPAEGFEAMLRRDPCLPLNRAEVARRQAGVWPAAPAQK